MTGTSRSVWLPVFAAYAAFFVGVVILGAAGIAALATLQLLGGWAPLLAGVLGVTAALAVLGIAPSLAYAFADEEDDSGAAQGRPLFFGDRSPDEDMFF